MRKNIYKKLFDIYMKGYIRGIVDELELIGEFYNLCKRRI